MGFNQCFKADEEMMSIVSHAYDIKERLNHFWNFTAPKILRNETSEID